jgi:hypothetical protein
VYWRGADYAGCNVRCELFLQERQRHDFSLRAGDHDLHGRKLTQDLFQTGHVAKRLRTGSIKEWMQNAIEIEKNNHGDLLRKKSQNAVAASGGNPSVPFSKNRLLERIRSSSKNSRA